MEILVYIFSIAIPFLLYLFVSIFLPSDSFGFGSFIGFAIMPLTYLVLWTMAIWFNRENTKTLYRFAIEWIILIVVMLYFYFEKGSILHLFNPYNFIGSLFLILYLPMLFSNFQFLPSISIFMLCL